MLFIVLQIIYYLLYIYGGILLLNILFSWIPSLSDYRIVRLLQGAGDWYMGVFRGRFVIGALDFTPMIGLLIYYFIIDLMRFIY